MLVTLPSSAAVRKTEALKGALVAKGVPSDRLSKLKAPAGLDLGAITPDEIAISILPKSSQCAAGKAQSSLQ